MLSEAPAWAHGIDLYDLSSTAANFDTCSARDYILKWGGPEVLEYAFDSLIFTYHFHGAQDLSLSCLLGAIAAIGPNFTYDYFVKGIDEIAQALARKVHVVLRATITDVNVGPHHVYLKFEDEKYHYDAIVIATTASAARRIYHKPSAAQRDLLEATNYSTTINASFKVPSLPISHLAMVAVPSSQNENICCYFNQASKYSGFLEDGQTLVNVFARDIKALELMDGPDEKIWQLMEQEFLKVCPPLLLFANRISRYQLQRWPEAIPKYSHGYVTKVANFLQNGQGDNGIFLCGDYLNAPWIEGSLRGGRKVAGKVLEHLSKAKDIETEGLDIPRAVRFDTLG